MERGSNLRAVAAAAYGHERFSGFVARFNDLPDPERVSAGAVLKTPSVSVALRDAGADPALQPALYALAKAWTDYCATEPAYLSARRASGVAAGTFPIPPEIKQKFVACADTIDAALEVLSSVRPPHSVPKMAIGQFRQAAGQIRELASGLIDGYGYDYDLVGQRFGVAFTNALIWTQQQHR